MKNEWEQLAAAAKSLQLCPSLCDLTDGSPPGFPIPGILQAKTLEWVAISFFNAWNWKVKVKSLSHVRLLVIPWTAAYQAPLSMGSSRQESWSGVPLPSLWISVIVLLSNSALLIEILRPRQFFRVKHELGTGWSLFNLLSFIWLRTIHSLNEVPCHWGGSSFLLRPQKCPCYYTYQTHFIVASPFPTLCYTVGSH